ncbi:MAG: hypothetical protein RL683_706 [Actinomycetota bacterium]|jgi:uncharacterized protein (TIGR01777 family)
MRLLISGASGLVGTELRKQFAALGHETVALGRGEKLTGDQMSEFDAVVNLAGATTGKIPWTKKYKDELISSRLETTRNIVDAINAAKKKPKVLVSGSASGFYGDTGTEAATEETSKGTGFLSDLAAKWEAIAKEANTRVVLVRTTMVMSRQLGALGKLLPLIKLGIGGPLGSGKQWWAWISLKDEARAIIHLIENAKAQGAYNLTAPQHATCTEIVRGLGKALGRPTILQVPSFAMRLLIGEAADELLLCNQKMTADKLLETGFKFEHPTLQSAIDYVVGKNPAE